MLPKKYTILKALNNIVQIVYIIQYLHSSTSSIEINLSLESPYHPHSDRFKNEKLLRSKATSEQEDSVAIISMIATYASHSWFCNICFIFQINFSYAFTTILINIMC